MPTEMPESVPVGQSSPRFVCGNFDGFDVTRAWFAPFDRIPPHRHDRPTFAVMLDGSFGLSVTGRVVDCEPNAVFTGPATERHSNRVGSAGAHVVVIEPDPERAELFRPCAPMLDALNHFVDPSITRLARRLVRELDRPDDVSPLSIHAAAFEMLARAARVGSPRVVSDRPRWLSRLEELVHDRFRERLRISELAVEIGVHPVHLARCFKVHHGVSISDYIRAMRLEWAAAEMSNRNATLASIALRAGFADQSHFTRAFRRYFGASPARYRRSLR